MMTTIISNSINCCKQGTKETLALIILKESPLNGGDRALSRFEQVITKVALANLGFCAAAATAYGSYKIYSLLTPLAGKILKMDFSSSSLREIFERYRPF